MTPIRLVALACALVAATAHAENDSREKARTYFQAGKADYEAGRFGEAAREFQKAYELTDEPELLYNLGQAYMRGGDAGRAVEAYEGYLRRVPQSKDRATVEATVRNLRKEIGSLRVVHVPPGATVEIDGNFVARAPFDETRPILATIGRREVTAREPDGHVVHREVVVEPDKVPTVDLAAEAAPVVVAPTPVPVPEKPAAPTENPRLRKIGLGLAVGGLALAVGGAVTLALAHSAANDAASAPSEDAWRSNADTASTLSPVGGALLGVGVVAAVGGAVAWFMGRPHEARVAVFPTTNGFAVAGVLP